MPFILNVPAVELYDERKNLFINCPAVTLVLEHSLIAISKWESTWKKPFVSDEQKTQDEFRDYIRCMTINKVDPSVYSRLGRKEFVKVQAYIDDPMTATTFHSAKKTPPKKEKITSELVYYWMDIAQVPWEAEKWHFNRLMSLIRIHSAKNSNDKMSKGDLRDYYRSTNAARRAKYQHKRQR